MSALPTTSTCAVALLCLLLSGCMLGPTIRNVPSLGAGEGIYVEVSPSPSGMTRTFELLAAERTGLYLRLLNATTSDLLYWIPYNNIYKAEFVGLTRLNFRNRQAPRPTHIRDIRSVSRYPQGIDDELLETLLRAYGQDEIGRLQ